MAHRTCEARVFLHGIDRPCGQRVGLRLWWDETGEQHMACRSHVAERQHRFAPADPPEPKWLPEQADPITAAKSYTDAGYTEAELRLAWGDR
jgi:hypothetical protein